MEVFIIKKLISVLLCAAIAASLASCGQKNTTNPNSATVDNPPVVVEQREYNYITGKAFAENQDKTARPIAVMINNAKMALPQSGLESADIIYEMVTEGGITRLMAIYSDINAMGQVGPVRSARDQFVQFLLPLNAIYVHIGTSIYAKDMLNFYSYQDIDGLYLGTTSFDFDKERNKDRGSEHCWFTKPNLVWDGIVATGLSTTGNLYPAFNFADYKKSPVTLDEGENAGFVYFRFSEYSGGTAPTTMTYNSQDNRYYKTAFGAPQIDKDTGTQVSFDNFILLTTDISLYPDGLCTSFDLSKGDGYYFYGGKYIPIKWEKGLPENPLHITDVNGEPIEINVGKSYVGVLGKDMLYTLVIGESEQAVQQEIAESFNIPTAENEAVTEEKPAE